MLFKNIVKVAQQLLRLLLPIAHVSGILRLSSVIILFAAAGQRMVFFRDLSGSRDSDGSNAKNMEIQGIKRAALLMLGMALLSVFFSVNRMGSLKDIFWIIFIPLNLFIFFACSRKIEAIWQQWSVLGSVLLLGLFTLGSAYCWSRTGTQGEAVSTGLWKYYPGPGLASTFMSFSLPFLWATALSESNKKRYVAIGLMGLVMWSAWLTGNRQFWIEWCVSMVWGGYWLCRKSPHRLRILLLAVLPLVGVMWVAIAHQTHERTNLSVPMAAHEDLRRSIWSYWYGEFLKAPLIGHGFGKIAQHQVYLQQFKLKQLPSEIQNIHEAVHAHNLVIDYLVQTGLMGTLAWAWLLLQLATLARHRAAVAKNGSVYADAVLQLMLIMLLKNMTDDFMNFEGSLYFWSEAGLLLALAAAENPVQPEVSEHESSLAKPLD